MNRIIIASLLTVLLAAGTVALTFAFRSPDATPKVFSPQEYREEEIAYRTSSAGEELTVRWEPDSAKVERGRLLYGLRCATCHGANGDGNPITPEGLSISPRDFTGKSHRLQKVVFKFNTSDRPDMLALDEDLKKTIREGLPGTPMPGYSTLSDEEIDAFLEYIKTFGYVAWRFNQPTQPALQVPSAPPDLVSQQRIDEGRELFLNRGCVACHGNVEQGGQPLQGLVTEWIQDGQPIPRSAPQLRLGTFEKARPPGYVQDGPAGREGYPHAG